jgi:hypothetical protein
MQTKNPIKTFGDGPIGASVWVHSTPAGAFYDVVFCRSWNGGGTGNGGDSQCYPDRDLYTLIDVAIKAKAWIEEQQAKADSTPAAA